MCWSLWGMRWKMNFCSDGHDDIFYGGRKNCPVCYYLEQIKDLESEVKKLKEATNEQNK
mgnify:CR=1 FL=1